MSTSISSQESSSTSQSPTLAPWRSLFLEHLSKLDSPEFVLSTLSRAAAGASTPFVPRARYCIYRGMLGEIPYSTHYDAATYGKNAATYESDMLTFTTDARMEKTSHILMTSSDSVGDGDGDSDRARPGSGGGGPVEAVFWIKEVMSQWRFKGEAYMIGPDIEEDDTTQAHETHVRSANANLKAKLMANMRRVAEAEEVDPSSNKAWSWQQEWHSHFGNLSPVMRGSFQNAPPGKPVGKPAPVPIPQKITGSLMAPENAIARGNFRVVVIRAVEVERLDLDAQRRWRWRRGASGSGSESGTERESESETRGESQQQENNAVSGLVGSTQLVFDGDIQWTMEELWP